MTHIPERYRLKTSKEVSVATKKRLFFRLLGPFVLRANELILGDRRRLEILAKESATSEADEAWVQALTARYKMGEMPNDAAIGDLIEALLMRVDIVPRRWPLPRPRRKVVGEHLDLPILAMLCSVNGPGAARELSLENSEVVKVTTR